MKQSLKEVKEKTLEILNSKDAEDVAHITEELINADFEEPIEEGEKSLVKKVYYGHDMAYVHSDRYNTYGYNIRTGSKGARSRSCGNEYGYFLAHNKYDHDKVGNCSSRDALLKFTEK